jgi:twitching motility protein PilT
MRRYSPIAEEVGSVGEKTVLVIHDDAAFVEQMRTNLARVAPMVRVVSALSAPRAMSAVASEIPDVIVVDAELTGVDGYAITQQLKGDSRTSGVPVVIVTLSPTEASALRARQAGAEAHLSYSGPLDGVVSKVCALAGQNVPARAHAHATADLESRVPSVTPAVPASAPSAAVGAGPVSAVASRPPTAAAATAVATPPPGYSMRASESDDVPTFRPDASRAASAGDVTVTRGDGSPGPDVPPIDDLLRLMLQRGGSDLHITVGCAPGIRQRGEIVPVENMQPLTPRDTMEMILGLLSEEQRRRFETELELDFAYSIPGISRFRANVFQQRNSMGAVFRVIPIQIPTIEDLSLPRVCKYLAERPRGLVLVTGPTGSGKSTTLAAMVDHINENRAVHIITLEDPIEFMHRNKKAYVNQREVGEDTHSFGSALKRVLRQDPDVILVGEMRDLETISAAITAAETGHLVLATLHTTGGPETVDRVIDVFPPHQQQQVRMQLSTTLEGVLSQVLLRSTDGRSRTMAMEIMLGIPAISNLIREGKTHQMETIIQGGAQTGMQTLDQHLKNLLTAGKITFEEAISKAKNPRELANMMGRKL